MILLSMCVSERGKGRETGGKWQKFKSVVIRDSSEAELSAKRTDTISDASFLTANVHFLNRLFEMHRLL